MYFIVPNRVEDNVFIDVLSEVVATGLRKLYSIITFDGLFKDVSYTISMFLFKLERLSDTSHLKLLDLCSLISVLFIHRLP